MKSLKILKNNRKPYIERQKIQSLKKNKRKKQTQNKQGSTKTTKKAKAWEPRIPLKPGKGSIDLVVLASLVAPVVLFVLKIQQKVVDCNYDNRNISVTIRDTDILLRSTKLWHKVWIMFFFSLQFWKWYACKCTWQMENILKKAMTLLLLFYILQSRDIHQQCINPNAIKW